MNVVSLHQPKTCEEVVATLRRIADELEGGALGWPVTTAVLICGHTDQEVPGEDGALLEQAYWTTYAMGPRTSSFVVRGLVASAMRNWNHEDD